MTTLPPLPPVAVRIRGVAVNVRPATLGFLARAAKAGADNAANLALVAELVDIDPAELTAGEMQTILNAAAAAGRDGNAPDFPSAPPSPVSAPSV